MEGGCWTVAAGYGEAWSGGVDGGTQVVREKENKVCYVLLFENEGAMGLLHKTLTPLFI